MLKQNPKWRQAPGLGAPAAHLPAPSPSCSPPNPAWRHGPPSHRSQELPRGLVRVRLVKELHLDQVASQGSWTGTPQTAPRAAGEHRPRGSAGGHEKPANHSRQRLKGPFVQHQARPTDSEIVLAFGATPGRRTRLGKQPVLCWPICSA